MTIGELQEVLENAAQMIGLDAQVFVEDENGDPQETVGWKLTKWTCSIEQGESRGRIVIL